MIGMLYLRVQNEVNPRLVWGEARRGEVREGRDERKRIRETHLGKLRVFTKPLSQMKQIECRKISIN